MQASPITSCFHPLLSIIIPSYNQGKYIGETIESCLQQDYRPIEIIVIDGASEDETLDVLRTYVDCSELTFVSEPDHGPVDAVNKGIARATGEIGLIQSADDVCRPGSFKAAVAAFQKDPTVGLVYGDCEVIDEGGKLLSVNRVGGHSITRLFSHASYVPQPCGFFRMTLARELGGWDERFPFCPDTELWFKLALHSLATTLPRVLGATRKHGAQRDHAHTRILSSYQRMLTESPYLQSLPWHLRQALWAGYAIVQMRYRVASQAESERMLLWLAIARWPPLLFSSVIPKHKLIPGYFTIACVVGKMKRLLRCENPLSNCRLFVGKQISAWRHWKADRLAYAAIPTGPPIFVTGAPRSGTTWLAAMLARPGVWHLHEPFNPNRRLWHENFSYIEPHMKREDVFRLLDGLQQGKFRRALQVPRSTSLFMPLRFMPLRINRIMIKDPTACLMTEYIKNKLEAQVVVVFRHPAAVSRSYYDLGWPSLPFLQKFLLDEGLMQGPLSAYKAVIQERVILGEETLESVATLHACLCKVLWVICNRDPDIIQLQYENLCENPIQAFRELYDQLGLRYDDSVLSMHEALCQPKQTSATVGPHEVRRQSQEMASNWKEKYTKESLDQVRRIWKAFDIPLYESDEEWALRNK